jgi:tRNA 2-thiouridine synthesizing protein B
MSTLHTVNKSPFTHSTLASCLQVCAIDDDILLIEDGVFGALKGSPCASELSSIIAKGVKVYALIDDINARGIQGKIYPEISTTNYEGFVRLSIEHRCVQSWY